MSKGEDDRFPRFVLDLHGNASKASRVGLPYIFVLNARLLHAYAPMYQRYRGKCNTTEKSSRGIFFKDTLCPLASAMPASPRAAAINAALNFMMSNQTSTRIIQETEISSKRERKFW